MKTPCYPSANQFSCGVEFGAYDIQQPGTFTPRHPVVEVFESRGWTWGGRWQFPLDLHHFEKVPGGAEAYVKQYRP